MASDAKQLYANVVRNLFLEERLKLGFAQKAKIPPTPVDGCVQVLSTNCRVLKRSNPSHGSVRIVQVHPIHLLCFDFIVTEVNSVDLNHPYTAV